MSQNLPFERGSTYFEGEGCNSSAAVASLLGHCYKVKNNGQSGVGHNNTETTLMVVQNLSGGALAGGRAVRFTTAGGTTASSMGATIAGYVDGVGNHGYPIDDAYGTGSAAVANKDIFYVVTEGPCNIETVSGAVLTKFGGVSYTAAGRTMVLLADHYTAGLSDIAGTAVTGTFGLVHVGARYNNQSIAEA